MANWLALSPVLILLLGAVVVLAARSLVRIAPIIVLGAILLSIALLFVNARQSDITPFLFPAFASAPDLDLGFDFGPSGIFFSCAALVCLLSVTILQGWNRPRRTEVGLLVTGSGAIAFFLAANWTTLAAAWLLTDFGFLIWRIVDSPDVRKTRLPWGSLVLSQFGALVFLGAGVLVTSEGSSLRFAKTSITGLAADLVLLAAWIRSGLYPFQVPIPRAGETDSPERLRRTALTVLMGGYLLARGLSLMQGESSYHSLLYAVALLGVVATALLVLVARESGPEVAWSVQALGALVPLTPFIAVLAQGAAFATWLVLGVFNVALLVLAANLVHTNTRSRPLRRILWGIAVLAAVGFPLTPAFLGRVGLYSLAARSGESLLVLALVAVSTIALVPLIRGFLQPFSTDSDKPNWLEYMGAAGLILPTIGEGLAPFFVTSVFGRDVEDASTAAFDALVHSSSLLSPIILMFALLLPLPLAFFVARSKATVGSWPWRLPDGLRRVLDLSGPGQALITGFDLVGVAARQVSALVEQHPIGWILLAAIWVAVWLLNGLAGR